MKLYPGHQVRGVMRRFVGTVAVLLAAGVADAEPLTCVSAQGTTPLARQVARVLCDGGAGISIIVRNVGRELQVVMSQPSVPAAETPEAKAAREQRNVETVARRDAECGATLPPFDLDATVERLRLECGEKVKQNAATCRNEVKAGANQLAVETRLRICDIPLRAVEAEGGRCSADSVLVMARLEEPAQVTRWTSCRARYKDEMYGPAAEREALEARVRWAAKAALDAAPTVKVVRLGLTLHRIGELSGQAGFRAAAEQVRGQELVLVR